MQFYIHWNRNKNYNFVLMNVQQTITKLCMWNKNPKNLLVRHGKHWARTVLLSYGYTDSVCVCTFKQNIKNTPCVSVHFVHKKKFVVNKHSFMTMWFYKTTYHLHYPVPSLLLSKGPPTLIPFLFFFSWIGDFSCLFTIKILHSWW